MGVPRNENNIKFIFVYFAELWTSWEELKGRYAVIDIESEMENPSDVDKEAEFTVQIPETAFISNFTMFINGELFIAEIKGRSMANHQ